MSQSRLPPSAELKVDVMFEGVRYSPSLGEAAARAFPNFYPYRFRPGEANPTGKDKVDIPYLMTLGDGTLIRIKGSGDAPWFVDGSSETGYRLHNESGRSYPIAFEPLPAWMKGQTSDGFPMAKAGVSLHADMAVINISPGCEYFLAKRPDGTSMRCTFCAYGAPNERVKHFDQTTGAAALPPRTYRRMQETLAAAIAETGIRHIYLVGGSMQDWALEGARFIELAREVQAVNGRRIPVSCGSGALPQEAMQTLYDESLVDHVCFNLETWSEPMFASVCPGKSHFVGYARWLGALEQAVALWGPGRVYSAMVAGVELEPEYGMRWEQAAALAAQGADALCGRGVIPIYSLYWPTGGKDHPEYFSRLRSFFERLNLDYQAIRERHGLRIADSFMCHRCAYMQLECDLDRAPARPGDDPHE